VQVAKFYSTNNYLIKPNTRKNILNFQISDLRVDKKALPKDNANLSVSQLHYGEKVLQMARPLTPTCTLLYMNKEA
jgi:hypothetical protein